MLVQTFGILALAESTPLEISYNENSLHVGKARIEREFIRSVEVLDAESMRKIRGPLADPACYMALRFWVSTGVKITLNDPKDPTPYWLVSTRRGKELAERVNAK